MTISMYETVIAQSNYNEDALSTRSHLSSSVRAKRQVR